MGEGLRYGALGPNCVHICVDMQRLFGPGYPWAVPWITRILPQVSAICGHNPARTVFTRFIPPARPDDARGTWRRYYEKWEAVTRDYTGPEALDLLPELSRYAPPAKIIDKSVYSPWLTPALDQLLSLGQVDTIFLTGGETDICVLATALGAIDRGFRLILIKDALCSSSDRTHDELMDLYASRFDTQIEVFNTDTLLANWREF